MASLSERLSVPMLSQTLKLDTDKKSVAIGAGVAAAGLAAAYAAYAWRRSAHVPTSGPYPAGSLPADAYDAVIVGAGPSGGVCAYFLAKNNAKVALLEKETLPRDKYCGNCVTTRGLDILQEMGVLKELIDNKETHFADSGGIVSPSGISYIGVTKERLGQASCCAIKRIHLDTRIARKAQSTGAELKEGFEVVDAVFDKATGLWTVTSATGQVVRGRVLVLADGATSKLATKLGHCTQPPKGVCSRAFVEPGTHNTDFDGVCFYPRWSLPGYVTIFKHPNDELNVCCYLIPCGKEGMCGMVKESDLSRLHSNAIKLDPFVSQALGPNAKLERMRAGSLRVGGQGVATTIADHLLIVGDAAGHIDPLTGEGIHTAMLGGKAAALTILDMKRTGDYSKQSCKQYERRWYKSFGHDFFWSQMMAEMIYRFPILLDATAAEFQRKGDGMLAKWGEIMTCMQPKTYFLRPDIAASMGIAIIREFVAQKVFGTRPDRYQLKKEPAVAEA